MAKAKNQVGQEDQAGAATDGGAASDSGTGPDTAATTVLARVLAHCDLGEPNDVVEIDPALAETMPGIVDANPEAVAYAQSISEE